MTELPSTIRTASLLGITLSTFWSGATFSLSTFFIPSLLTLPATHSLPSFTRMYNLGKNLAVPFSVISGLSFAYIAYTLPSASHPVYLSGTRSRDRDFWMYSTAAVLSASFPFYTLALMKDTNGSLLDMAREVGTSAEAKGIDERVVRELVAKWGRLNFGRSVLGGVAGLVGLWATIM